ncbi:MAG: hypothetical protein SWE60_10120 [Thermodesulfobacteriota bacterium]|nr:hypothetical protein [Thermodesulfobacteriota bacterium]
MIVTTTEGQTRDNAIDWQRWDEELVEELGRWLTRLAKVFAILICGVFAALYVGCF